MTNFAYNSILHDLSFTPREMSAAETVAFWLGGSGNFFLLKYFQQTFLEMFQTKNVTEWTETFRAVDLPDLRLTFAGLFGHLLLLQFDFNTTVAITSPLIGGSESSFEHFYRIRNIQTCLDSQRNRRSFSLITIYPYWIQKWRI